MIRNKWHRAGERKAEEVLAETVKDVRDFKENLEARHIKKPDDDDIL